MTEVIAALERCPVESSATAVDLSGVSPASQEVSAETDSSKVLTSEESATDAEDMAATATLQRSDANAPTIITSSISNTIQSNVTPAADSERPGAGRPAWTSDKRVLAGAGAAVLLLIFALMMSLKKPAGAPDDSDDLLIAASADGSTEPATPNTGESKLTPTETANKSNATDRVLAEFVLSNGGYVCVDDQNIKINDEARLPPGRFRLTAIGMICRKTITDAALARFKNCKSLKGLDLDLTASPVTNAGLAHFNGCQQLTSLVLRGSQHVTDAGLAHFQDRDLTRLVLHSELMTNVGLETFRHCKNLKDLDLNMSQATDTGAAVFKDCSLIHLTLRSNNITDAGASHFKGITTLHRLALLDTQVTNACLANFYNCTNLKTLWLNGSEPITGSGISRFTKLAFLKLNSTSITDVELSQLNEMKWLSELNVTDTKVTAAGVAKLKTLGRLETDFSDEEIAAARTSSPAPAGLVTVPPLAVAPFDADQAKAHQEAWAKHLGMPVEKEVELPGGEKMAFMLISPGEFMMGSTEDDIQRFQSRTKARNDELVAKLILTESPRHRVRISRPYYLGKYEVTQSQWQSVMGDNPSKIKDAPLTPVTMIGWDDATEFVEELNDRHRDRGRAFGLPTESQWEFACRAGTTTAWSFGDTDLEIDKFAWNTGNANRTTHLVGQLLPNSFRLFDMHGNVGEWCSDRYSGDAYQHATLVNPSGPESGRLRIRRGGNIWGKTSLSRSASRRHGGVTTDDQPGFREDGLGVRLLMTIDTAQPRTTQTPPVTTDRSVAEWVMGIGGTIVTDMSTGKGIKVVGELPKDQFRIGLIDLNDNKQFNDGLVRFTSLTNLSHLYIERTQVSDEGLRHLKGLTNLTLLHLRGTSVSDAGLIHLKGLTNLTLLHLRGTSVSDAGLIHLKGLTNLDTLTLNSTKIGNKGLEHIKELTKLRALTLSDTQVSDAGLEHLKKLQNLKSLYLKMTMVTAPGVADLQKSLPNCRIEWNGETEPDRAVAELALRHGAAISITQEGKGIVPIGVVRQLPQDSFAISLLELQSAQLTPAELSHLDKLTGLRSLDLSGTNLAKNRLEFLSKNSGLRFVRLLRCGIVDSDLKHLSGLTKELVTLDLAKNELTNAGLAQLTELKALTFLDLQGNLRLTNSGLEPLHRLSNLADLRLSGTAVTRDGVEKFSDVLPNCTISFTHDAKVHIWPSDSRAAHERSVADWVLSVGGAVTAAVPGTDTARHEKPGNLPETRFTILAVDLAAARSISDDDLQQLRGLNDLQNLTLHNQKEITDEGLVHLAKLKNLHHLFINNTRISGSGFKYLKDIHLHHLNMMCRTITDEGLKHLAHLERLKTIDLQDTEIGDNGLKVLSEYRNLQKITLTGTKITDAGLKHLKQLKRLEQVIVLKTQVTPAGVNDLQHVLPECRIVGP